MKFINLLKSAVVCAALVPAFSAYAQKSSSQQQHSPFYFGIGGGVSDHNNWKNPSTTYSSLDTSGTQIKAFIGYNYTNFLAAEFSYNDLGKSTGAGTNIVAVAGTTKAKATVLAAKISPLSGSQVSPFLKLGGAYLENLENSGTTTSKTNYNKRTTEFYYAVGVDLPVSKNIGLVLEYENFGANGSTSSSSSPYQIKPTAYSLSIRFNY